MKRSWIKPELIVLTSRKSDERMLSGCKVSLGGATSCSGGGGCR